MSKKYTHFLTVIDQDGRSCKLVVIGFHVAQKAIAALTSKGFAVFDDPARRWACNTAVDEVLDAVDDLLYGP